MAGRDVYIFGGEYLFGYGDWQTSVWRWDSFRNLWHMETKYAIVTTVQPDRVINYSILIKTVL